MSDNYSCVWERLSVRNRSCAYIAKYRGIRANVPIRRIALVQQIIALTNIPTVLRGYLNLHFYLARAWSKCYCVKCRLTCEVLRKRPNDKSASPLAAPHSPGLPTNLSYCTSRFICSYMYPFLTNYPKVDTHVWGESVCSYLLTIATTCW